MSDWDFDVKSDYRVRFGDGDLLLSFQSDRGAEAFDAWLNLVGKARFEDWADRQEWLRGQGWND